MLSKEELTRSNNQKDSKRISKELACADTKNRDRNKRIRNNLLVHDGSWYLVETFKVRVNSNLSRRSKRRKCNQH